MLQLKFQRLAPFGFLMQRRPQTEGIDHLHMILHRPCYVLLSRIPMFTTAVLNSLQTFLCEGISFCSLDLVQGFAVYLSVSGCPEKNCMRLKVKFSEVLM